MSYAEIIRQYKIPVHKNNLPHHIAHINPNIKNALKDSREHRAIDINECTQRLYDECVDLMLKAKRKASTPGEFAAAAHCLDNAAKVIAVLAKGQEQASEQTDSGFMTAYLDRAKEVHHDQSSIPVDTSKS